MPKKTKRKTVANKLDKIWSLIVRAEGECELCQRQGKLDAHHIEGRSPQVLRWNLANGIALCFRCHRLGVHSPASSVQSEFRAKIIDLRGGVVLEELKNMRYNAEKISTPDLRELLEVYKEKLKSLT